MVTGVQTCALPIYVKLLHVVEVKNYIFNVTGRMVSTSDALGLYLRMYDVLNRNN